MSRPLQRLQQFVRELKRRNVYKVAATYAAVAFVSFQLVSLLIPATTIPGWGDELLLAFLIAGFPVSIVVAWAFEMTPEGVRRTRRAASGGEGDTGSGSGVSTSYKLLVGIGVVAITVAGGWYLTGAGEPETGTRAAEPSIAVLPFDALSPSEDTETFARGIHDDLLTRLYRISDLEAISRTAVERYRDTELTMAQIADELGVAWVMEGGVEILGDEIQVTAQLIDPRTETPAWAETYRRELTAENLFDLQSEITERVARSLQAELTESEVERVGRQDTRDLDAYRLYVKARNQMDPRTEDGLRAGIHLFQQAIAQDSSYALAWSGLADARTILVSRGVGDQGRLHTAASRAARRALELDPTLAEAHASIGLLRYNEHQGPEALRWLERAVELKRDYLRAQHWLGLTLLMLGRPDRSVEHLERAVELDPTSAPIRASLTIALSYTDRFEEALDQCRQWEALEPDASAPIQYRGRLLLAMNRTEESIRVGRYVLEDLDPSPLVTAWARAWLVVANHASGDTVRARQVLSRLSAMKGVPVAKAAAHVGLGDGDRAIATLEAEQAVDAAMRTLRYDPVFESLRDDPRIEKMIRDFNVSWGLNPDGSIPDSIDVTIASGSDG